MIIAFNNTLLRVCVSALARALYQIDFDLKLECCPSQISHHLSELVHGSIRSNAFDIPTMELLFRDQNFRYIFQKVYVINSSFVVKKKYSDYKDYSISIKSMRVDIIKNLCERWRIDISDMNEFISKFTTNFVKHYNDRISYLTELELKSIKIKEESKQQEIKDMRNVPMSNNTRSKATDDDETWLDANDRRAPIRKEGQSIPIFIEPIPKTPKDSQSVQSKKRKRTPESNTSTLTAESLESQVKSATDSELVTLFRSEIKRRKIILQPNIFIQSWDLTEEGYII
jgi:hypothetical protein